MSSVLAHKRTMAYLNVCPQYNPLFNQACHSHKLADVWFFEVAFLHAVCMCLCIHPRGYKLHSRDIDPVQQVK